jgi:hypothetical protein
MGELANKQESNIAMHPNVSEETRMMMQMIEQVALNPEADVEKLRAVWDMKMDMFNRGAEIEFNAAMCDAQAEMKPVIAKSVNDQTSSKYAKLEKIIEECSPIWTKHGFALTFGTGTSDKEGFYRVECEVSHRSGHSKKYQADLPADMVGIKGSVNKTPIHGFGSTMAYGRRYLTGLVFNIPVKGEDNDGNTQPKEKPKAADQPLTTAQLNNLRQQLNNAGISEAQMCERATVQRVEDLVQGRLAGALNWIKRQQKEAQS